jgi:hypothetical protein
MEHDVTATTLKPEEMTRTFALFILQVLVVSGSAYLAPVCPCCLTSSTRLVAR